MILNALHSSVDVTEQGTGRRLFPAYSSPGNPLLPTCCGHSRTYSAVFDYKWLGQPHHQIQVSNGPDFLGRQY